MTKLPDRNLLDGTKSPETTTGEFRLAMGNLRQYLFELLGDEGGDKETARLALGIDLAELIGKISENAGQQDVETALALKADLTELSGVAFTGNYNDLIDKLEKSTTLEGYGILVDNIPTDLSTRPVTSSGIKSYVDMKIANAVVPHGMQVFMASGTFAMKSGLAYSVQLWGGGGGGANYSTAGGSGGTSSFGGYMTASGGGGGYRGSGGKCAVPLGDYGNGGAGYGYIHGTTGNAFSGSSGGGGGFCEGIVTPNSDEIVNVMSGLGGGGYSPGKSGICIIRW